MQDATELSVRDLAYLMMAFSDNHATDVVLGLLGRDRVNATMRDLVFPQTQLEGDCAALFDAIATDLGADYDTFLDQYEPGRDHHRMTAIRALTAANTNRTTARESTRLLSGLWRDELLTADAASEVRRVLGQQVWTNRITAGFPEHGTRVSGKTGTILDRRCEVGVVETTGGGRYAVAVFVVHPDPYPRQPAADAVIGQVARLAVDHLRS
jgi:beta-lactamase class A